MKAANPLRVPSEWVPDELSSVAIDDRSFGPATEDPTGRTYNQEMFRYFLQLERKRSGRSGRPFLLLLVELRNPSETDARFEPTVAGKVFDVLWQSLRETDFIGWYRAGRIAGAVLTQPMEMAGPDISRTNSERLGEALREKLTHQGASRLQVRVYQLPASSKEQSEPWL
jgi:hypothetical protein